MTKIIKEASKVATLTRKDLREIYHAHNHFRSGYCCWQDDGKSRFDMVKLGSNSGVYGWNWSVYLDTETDTVYCDCYRNVPNDLVEK